MDLPLETSLETMNLTGQQQPISIPDVQNTAFSDFDKILADPSIFQNDELFISFDSNNTNEQFDINDLINSSNDQFDSLTLDGNPLTRTSLGNEDILQLIEEYEKDPSQGSTFIENYDQTNLYQSQQIRSPPSSIPAGSSPVEQKSIDNLIYAQTLVEEQYRIYNTASKPKKNKTSRRQSATVGPVDYILHSGGCQPCTTVQIQNDYAYQQQLLEYDAVETKKIQIISNPRSKFRPRTQNESKTSSHYLRCEDGIKPEYPTIQIPSTWSSQSDVNLIEVALMGIDKQPHPYTIDNKTRSDTYEDHALIFKQNDPNILYFRITNEDFQNGYKTFMLELIKSKQDDVITKELIRTRQLEHSMLRFTRIYQVGKNDFQRDDDGAEYSSVMSEAYGDVDIEHMGPPRGRMSGHEMVYIVLKGRVLKNDIIIDITENLTGWSFRVDNFTKNGNVIYFLMPAFPHLEVDRIAANINIYYKGEELYQFTYLYNGALDRDFAELGLNDPCATNLNPFDLLSATNARPAQNSRKTSKSKCTKRLQKK